MITIPLAHHAVTKKYLLSSFKLDYLCALEYFLRKYGEDNIQAKAFFNVYKDIISPCYSYCGDDKALEIVRSFLGTKFDFMTLYYRFDVECLFVDCLYMLAFSDVEKARIILNDFCSLSAKRYSKNFYRLFDYLYAENHSESLKYHFNIKYQIESWNAEKNFERKPLRKILFTAPMSAGKSTLINALIGKKISRTQSTACTGKIHYIYNKPYEDGFTAKFEDNFNMNASESQLMTYESNSERVNVWTYFRSFLSDSFRWCLIDTPGVNYSMNSGHREITRRAIEKESWDYLVYIIDGEYSGTDDDKKHLEYIYNYVPENKIIFVLNKLDSYESKDDSISEAVMNLRNYLEQTGFQNPVICPISAYAAMLAKKALFKIELSKRETKQLPIMFDEFQESEYDLSVYSTGLTEIDRMQRLNIPEKLFAKKNPLVSDCYKLITNSGLLGLEKILGSNPD